MKQRAVFLDRDGTINEEMGYINHISRFVVFDYVPEAIRLINEAGFRVIVVTNQSGVARGYFTENLVHEVHNKLLDLVKQAGGIIDQIYYCPHHPTEGIAPYRKDCSCRKPKTGMLRQAVKDFNIDLKESVMIGDRYKDMKFGWSSGLISMMVMTGYGIGEYTYQRGNWDRMPDYIFKNLLEAAQYIHDNYKS